MLSAVIGLGGLKKDRHGGSIDRDPPKAFEQLFSDPHVDVDQWVGVDSPP